MGSYTVVTPIEYTLRTEKARMKRVTEIMRDVPETNEHSLRLERRNALNGFSGRVTEWLSALDGRQKGPSGKLMEKILDDLEGLLRQMKRP